MSYFASDRSKRVPRSLGALAGDEAAVEMTEAEWQARMLQEQVAIRKSQEAFVRNDERARWLQLGATLLIPVAATIWRAILKRQA